MKIFVSGDTQDELIARTVASMGHEAITINSFQDGKGVQGKKRASILDTQGAVALLSREIKIGIGDHRSANAMGIPALSVTFDQEIASNAPKTVRSLSFGGKIKYVTCVEDLKRELDLYFESSGRKIEGQASLGKERK